MLCRTGHFGLQNRSFRLAIWAILQAEMTHIGKAQGRQCLEMCRKQHSDAVFMRGSEALQNVYLCVLRPCFWGIRTVIGRATAGGCAPPDRLPPRGKETWQGSVYSWQITIKIEFKQALNLPCREKIVILPPKPLVLNQTERI